jgi:hypothetical protein
VGARACMLAATLREPTRRAARRSCCAHTSCRCSLAPAPEARPSAPHGVVAGPRSLSDTVPPATRHPPSAIYSCSRCRTRTSSCGSECWRGW